MEGCVGMKGKNIKILLLIILLLTALISTGCSKKTEKEEAVANTVIEANTVEAFGVVKALDERNILIDFPAQIEKIEVKEGQLVKKDSTLLTLNIDGYLRLIENKEHELKILELEKGKLEKRIYGNLRNDPQIKRLIGNLEYTQKVYNQTKEEFISKERLYKEGAISKEDYENFRLKLSEIENAVNDARFNLEINSNLKEGELKDLSIKNQSLEILKNEILDLKEKLNKSYINNNNIICDVNNGIIYDISYKEGDIVSEERKLFSIIDYNNIIIEAEIPEEFIKDVHLNSDAVIIPLADKSKEYYGKVTYISSKGIIKSGETVIPIEITLSKKDDFLLPNFNVDVSIKSRN